MFETMLIATLFSISTVLVGNVLLLAVTLGMSRARRRKRAAATAQAAPVVVEAPAEELIEEEPILEEEPEFEGGSIIIANDYEEEAQPVRTTPEFLDDSFVNLFEDIPVITSASLPWREKHQRKSRMANRLERLTAPPSQPSRPSSDSRVTRPSTPLPMPVAPAGVEPIPELEPTELIIDRPEWAAEWP